MSDLFNQKARAILREADINGGLNEKSLFDLIVASHDESVEVAEKLAKKVEESSLLRTTERTELHEWQQAQAARCAAEHRRLFEDELARVAARAPRRRTDPETIDYGSGVALAFCDEHDRERYDKLVRSKFMSSTTKYIVIVIVAVMLAALAYTLLVEHHDLTADLATGLSSTIAVTMLIWAMLRKDRQ